VKTAELYIFRLITPEP